MPRSLYDPNQPPEPRSWLALDEAERIRQVEVFHRKARIRLPTARGHAALHVIVENQIALGSETPAAATLARLTRQGLSRHDALHAIATVLAEHLNALQRGEFTSDRDPNDAYYAALAELTPESWRRRFT
jgi:hypothetical protein